MKPALLITVPILLLSGCSLFRHAPPQTVTVVAPAGQATKDEGAAIEAHLATLDASLSAFTGALSKVSASAGAIKSINGGQPTGPRTSGVDGEAGIILTVAGPANPVDLLAASERARIVALGNAEAISQSYNTANLAAQDAKKQLGDTQIALTASNQALAKARADALTEQSKLQSQLQASIDAMKRDGDARVAAAQSKADADQRRLITWIFFGGGALFLAAGIAIMLFASSVPIFGPKAGIAVMGAGAGLIMIGMVMNELAKHPWIIWTGISLCLAALAVALGLIVSNHFHAPKTPVTPPTS